MAADTRLLIGWLKKGIFQLAETKTFMIVWTLNSTSQIIKVLLAIDKKKTFFFGAQDRSPADMWPEIFF